MVYLLDVNVIVALFDPAHLHHEAAHEWFGGLKHAAWAACPLSVNGAVRVLWRLRGGELMLAEILDAFREFLALPGSEFWTADPLIANASLFHAAKLQGPGQLTDALLLGLAVQHGGRLVTFDRALAGTFWKAVEGARPDSVCLLSVTNP
jgi:uncharacterized protein